jgi:mono/diheme cytochrome c family protein
MVSRYSFRLNLRRVTPILGIALVLLAACGPSSEQTKTTASESTSASPVATAPADSALANGKAIFQTGRDLQGTKIVAQPAAMMPNCAACHRANGSGGLHLAGGATSADLRYNAMVTQQKPPYTMALLERAVSRGVDNAGHPLNPVMPRWRLSARDLHDVSQYVLTQLK